MKTKSIEKLVALAGLLLTTGASQALAASLVWSGTSIPATNWDVSITPNWRNGVAAAYFNDGDAVTFNDNGISTNIFLAANVSPAAVTVDTTTHIYSISGTNSIVGTGALLKKGSSTLTLSSSNAFSGGLIISNGTVALGSSYGAGSGIITLAGGTLNLGSSAAPGNILSNVANSTVTGGSGSGQVGIYKVAGSNTLNIAITASVFDLRGDMTAFSGTVALGTSGNTLRFNGTTGSSVATFDLGSGTAGVNIRNNSAGPFALGALTGGAGTKISGNGNNNQMANYSIGGNNLSTVFNGAVINGTYPTALTKTGSGTLTLAGTNNYTGSTTVNGGVLALSGSAAITNSSSIGVAAGAVLDVSGLPSGLLTVSSNQVLKGGGTVRGSVTMSSSSTLQPGDGVGALTITNAITLAGTNLFELNNTLTPNSDRVVANAITYGGTLNVTNVGPGLTAGQTFQLFSQVGSGSFTSVNLATNDANYMLYTWTNKLAYDGTIQVLSATSAVNTSPTTLTNVCNGANLTLSWPLDHKGWKLQTNAVDVVNTNFWFALPGSENTNRVIITPDPAKSKVFYRLAYP